MERQGQKIQHADVVEVTPQTPVSPPPKHEKLPATPAAGLNTTAPLSIVIAATFTAEPLERPLSFWAQALDIPASISVSAYAQVLQELLRPESAIYRNRNGVNILLVRPEDWLRDLHAQGDEERNLEHLQSVGRDFLSAIENFHTRTSAPMFVFLSPASASLANTYRNALQGLEHTFATGLRRLPNVHYWTHADLMRLYPVASYENSLGERLGHIPYTDEYFIALATLFVRRIAALTKPPFKAIALDCDNTLWSGLCGEDGPGGVELTPAHVALQQMLVRQHHSGMLICLCSKNNADDVAAVFRVRRDMPLREEHVVSSRINWEPKFLGLRSLSSELGLGLDSFIFIDDSPLECAEVRAHCPSTLVLQFPDTQNQILHFLDHVWGFDRIGVTEEAKRRTALYKEAQARDSALRASVSIEHFLATLELQVVVDSMQPHQLARAAELVQRTNQFNLTTIRRRIPEIEDRLNSGELQSLTVHVKDRFGNYGLTGLLFLRRTPQSLDVDTFILSCRVLGRGVEYQIVNELGRIARREGLPTITLRYRKTARNQPARDFLHASFLNFMTSAGTNEEQNTEQVFTVPMHYAEQVTPAPAMHSAADETPKTDSAPPKAAPGSTQWHETGYRLSRVADIAAEIELAARQAHPTPGNYVAPRTPMETAIAQIWAELLSVEAVGIHDDFFALGGDSLIAVQAITRIARTLGVELTLDEYFERPTVAQLYDWISMTAETSDH